ncbi:MAG: chemotaxis protein CheX [Dehalococcoidia bacterium]
MQVEIIEAFITAALEVLEQEVGEPASAGPVKMLSSAQTSEEVCVMIGVAGALRGMALLGMSVETARSLVERMLGEPCLEFDDMAQSGIAEMANVITGVAGQRLESLGYPLTISPRR